jgi:AraC-like DNA-binding protein
MPPLIRSAVLTDYVELAWSVSLDPFSMIAEFGLPPACLTDPEIKVPAVAIGRLLEESALRSGKIDFGLRLAERRTMSNLGALALLVREQPTIRKALDVLVGYMFLHSEALHLKMDQFDELIVLDLSIDAGRPIPLRQGIEVGIGFLHRSLQQLFRESWKPHAVHFTHTPPARKDAHLRFFRTKVEFNQDRNGIVCLSRDLEANVPAADATLARHVQRYLDTLASRRSNTMSASVRECIYVMLPSGLCSADHVAKRLGVDRRTVHRHLAREGATFSSMIDSVRRELAAQHVGNRDRPLASVAELLGFSALSAFSRWFRSEFGCSVSEWRAAQLPSVKS